MLKKLFFSEEKDICSNCGEACAITDVLCPQCGKNLDELFEQLPDLVTTPCTSLGSITTLRIWRSGVINRNWKKALLALAVLSGLAVTCLYFISYFHKAAVLARLLDPKLTVVGEI